MTTDEYLKHQINFYLDGLRMAVTPTGFNWERVMDFIADDVEVHVDGIYGTGYTRRVVALMLIVNSNETPDEIIDAAEVISDPIDQAIADFTDAALANRKTMV